MSKQKLIIFYFLLFFVYTQGLWERVFFFIPFVGKVVDIFVVLFLLFKFKFYNNVPGSRIFFVFIFFSFFLGIVNSSSIIDVFLYIRFTIFSYLIYNQLYNLNINTKQWVNIFRFIVFMILIQALGSMYSIFFLNNRVEGYVGLMSSLGGTTATIFPLFISIFIFIYFLGRPKIPPKVSLILVLLLACCFLVGYASGKRAIYFVLPLFFLATIVIMHTYLTKTNHYKKKLLNITLVGLLCFPIIIYGVVNSNGLNYNLTGNETYLEIIQNSINYAENYESATDQNGNTIGRSNTTNQILNQSISNFSFFFLGVGFDSVKDIDTMNDIGYRYGIVGLTRDIISGGFILVFLTILLFYKMIVTNNSLKIRLTKIIRSLLIIFFLFTYLFYSSDFTVSLKINLILVIILAFVNSPKHSISFINIIKKNKI